MPDTNNFSSTKPNLKVFITHGRDPLAKKQLIGWLKRRKALAIEPIDFDSHVVVGDAAYATLERVAAEGDAAVILATPDDLGRLATDEAEEPRARQNVWMELGWFWARLGRRRTLVLVKGDVDVPRNYEGIKFIQYKDNISEVSDELGKYFESLRRLEPDDHTELMYLSSNPNTREQQWHDLHEAAKNELIVTGVAMGQVRHAIRSTFHDMNTTKRHLRLTFVVTHPEFSLLYEDLFLSQHGPNSVKNNHSFFKDILFSLKEFPDVAERVRFVLYRGIPPFAVVVADGPVWGSDMLVQPFVINPREHAMAHPRFKLRRRAERGVYMTYWNSVDDMIRNSSEHLIGLKALRDFVKHIEEMRK